jgi:hypothetical protein
MKRLLGTMLAASILAGLLLATAGRPHRATTGHPRPAAAAAATSLGS